MLQKLANVHPLLNGEQVGSGESLIVSPFTLTNTVVAIPIPDWAQSLCVKCAQSFRWGTNENLDNDPDSPTAGHGYKQQAGGYDVVIWCFGGPRTLYFRTDGADVSALVDFNFYA